MTEEFNLSKRKRKARLIENNEYSHLIECYWDEDVKEFIKRLKEEIHIENFRDNDLIQNVQKHMCDAIENTIDKLAGKNLT